LARGRARRAGRAGQAGQGRAAGVGHRSYLPLTDGGGGAAAAWGQTRTAQSAQRPRECTNAARPDCAVAAVRDTHCDSATLQPECSSTAAPSHHTVPAVATECASPRLSARLAARLPVLPPSCRLFISHPLLLASPHPTTTAHPANGTCSTAAMLPSQTPIHFALLPSTSEPPDSPSRPAHIMPT
jgi:hypothetical protein